ncbi:hypothetical protein N9293_00035 [Planctomycetota bacterium]|jgi:hypothetical protein|nr:hypothetical protein [bacterium]MDB2576130.1 hypothetical protein [Planctomycetota bacterium]MDB4401474.1 hypothetical protein [bacterium]MDB4559269.1 hypothetical protein [Planctomycetota bacterium]MDB4736256.1 hypothetical protein [Planctomycetota bacterium]
MAYPTRTIALLCELLHPAIAPDPRPIQRLHNEMFEGGQPAYAGFQVSPIGPILSNPMATPGAVSQVAFLADRMQFREEKGTLTHEAFAARVREIAERAAPLRGISTLSAQQVVLQSLVNPRTQTDTRAFLKDRVFGFGDELKALGRTSQLVGLRLGFSPEPGDDSAFGLRVESYSADPRSLYIEVHGTFGPADPAGGLEALEQNVLKTYDFLAGRVLPFISNFDRREGGRNTPPEGQ